MMTEPSLDGQLDDIPLFAAMSPHERKRIIGVATCEVFSPGEVVLEQGGQGQDLWVVLEGTCKVIKQSQKTIPCAIELAELRRPDHFGEMSFFQPEPHSASVEAITPLSLLRIPRDRYDQLLEHDEIAAYKLALKVVDSLADRLRRMDHWVSDLVCSDQPREAASEWNHFRDKLFKHWSL